MKIDYILHFVTGFIIALFCGLILSILSYDMLYVNTFTLILSIIIALLKELFDRHVKLTRFDKYDFLYTVLGSALALLMLNIFLI